MYMKAPQGAISRLVISRLWGAASTRFFLSGHAHEHALTCTRTHAPRHAHMHARTSMSTAQAQAQQHERTSTRARTRAHARYRRVLRTRRRPQGGRRQSPTCPPGSVKKNSDQAQNGPVFLLIRSSTGDRAACRCPLLRLRGAGVGALAFFEKTRG